jgi:hypothetical protein
VITTETFLTTTPIAGNDSVECNVTHRYAMQRLKSFRFHGYQEHCPLPDARRSAEPHAA